MEKKEEKEVEVNNVYINERMIDNSDLIHFNLKDEKNIEERIPSWIVNDTHVYSSDGIYGPGSLSQSCCGN